MWNWALHLASRLRRKRPWYQWHPMLLLDQWVLAQSARRWHPHIRGPMIVGNVGVVQRPAMVCSICMKVETIRVRRERLPNLLRTIRAMEPCSCLIDIAWQVMRTQDPISRSG